MRNEVFTVVDDISINITNVNGKTIEVSRLLLNLEIYESIFEYFLSGKITLADTLDIPQNLPIIGNESVEISITTTDTSKTLTYNFKIYKMGRDIRAIRGDIKRKILDLYICSEEKIKDNIVKVSKKFTGTGDSIVTTAISYLESTKSIDSSTSSDDTVIFSNYWKPSRVISLATRLSKTSSYSDFVFFENLDGFVFKPLSELLNQSPIYDITYKTDQESTLSNKNIKIMKFNDYFDVNSNSESGLFGNTLYKPSMTEYSYNKVESSLTDVINDIVTHGLSLPYDIALASSINNVDTNHYDPDIATIRLTSIKLFQNYNLVVKMNGDFDRSVGDVVNVDFPNYDNENNIHSSFDGRWMVTGIRHVIGQNNQYDQNVLLVKNAFFNNSDLTKISSLVNI